MNDLVKVIPILTLLVLFAPVAASGDYSNILDPTPFGNSTVTWRVIDAPEVPFSFFWAGSENWFAVAESIMSFTILDVGDDILGELTLGNVTLTGNDTDIAKDLTLGVWGNTEFHPGLFIKISISDVVELNHTAYAAAARTLGNYLNGTMVSAFEEVVC